MPLTFFSSIILNFVVKLIMLFFFAYSGGLMNGCKAVSPKKSQSELPITGHHKTF